jgi:serine/threonine protein kinase
MSSVQPVPASPDPDAAQVQVVPASPTQPMRPASPAARSPADQALDASARVGEYHVVRLLAADEGGFTYLARDLLLQRDVVVSEHLPFALAHRNASGQVVLATAGDANAFITLQRAFIEAAQRHARFDHPACVPLWRCWYSNGTAYAAMPYHGGTTLTEMRRTMAHPPEEQWLRAIARPLLDALESLHAQPVLHLGVSPDRVAVRADGRAVMLAAGTSRALAPAHPMAAFQAPELRARSEPLPLGAWTDLYGLAATMYFAITGEAPPTAGQARSDGGRVGPLARALTDICGRWPHLSYSAGLVRTIDRALSSAPAARPQSAMQFRSELDARDASRVEAGLQDRPSPAAVAASPQVTPVGGRPVERQPARSPSPDSRSVPILTDTAKIDANAEVTWFGPTDPAIASDLRKTLGSPIPDPAPGEASAWVATRYPDPKQPSRRRRLPQFALAAAMALGLFGVAAHLWNERQRSDEVRARLAPAAGERTPMLNPPAPPALPEIASPAADTARGAAVAGDSRDATLPAAQPDLTTAQTPPTPTARRQPESTISARTADPTSASVTGTISPTNASPVGVAPRPVPPVPPVSAGAGTTSAGTAVPAAPAPTSPRAACAGRSNFSLVYCMEQQCERDRFRNHPQCISLRATGEVE